MRTLNKLTAGLVGVAMLGTILTGCQSASSPEAKDNATANEVTVSEAPAQDTASTGETTEVTEEKPMVGGWSIASDNTPVMMDDEDSTRIESVLKEEKADFEVLDLVATQVVAGVNYMYLVYGINADSQTPGYYFVTVYEDLKGNDSIIGITPIEVTSIQTGTPLGEGATGAWAVRGTGKPGMLPDENAQSSFDAINTGDVMYNPIALLATQLVSGMNYKALCRGKDQNLYVVTWYRDLQGNSSLTSAEYVDIGAYSGR